MKKFFALFVVVVSVFSALVSCKLNYISINSNAADFTLTNKTTGKSVENKGVVISNGSSVDMLDIKAGDELELVFTPETQYQKYDWNVDFELYNNEVITVTSSPYKHTFTVGDAHPGSYYVNCKASISDRKVKFEGVVTGWVMVRIGE